MNTIKKILDFLMFISLAPLLYGLAMLYWQNDGRIITISLKVLILTVIALELLRQFGVDRMNYIYIGTDEELKQNGFIFIVDSNFKAIRKYKGRISDTFIEHNNNVVYWSKKDIQDLIKLGLIRSDK